MPLCIAAGCSPAKCIWICKGSHARQRWKEKRDDFDLLKPVSLTVEHMQLHARAVQVARAASIVTRVLPSRVVDHQAAHRVLIDPLRLNVDLGQLVVEDAIALVVPKHVERALEGLLYHASYRHRAASLHVHVAVPQDLDLWHCNAQKCERGASIILASSLSASDKPTHRRC